MDGSIIVIIACCGHTGSCPALIVDCLSLHAGGTKVTAHIFSLDLVLYITVAHHGAVAKVAYAHYNSNRFVLDDWIFGYQGAPHLLTEREMGEELSVVPHPFPQ